MKPDKEYNGRSRIRIYNVDCMELLNSGETWDLAIVDPPYGIGAGKRDTRHYFDKRYDESRYKQSDFDEEIPSIEYFKLIFDKSLNQIIWGGNYFAHILPQSRGWVFWDKKPVVPNYSDGELAWTSFDKVLKRCTYHWNGRIRTATEPSYKAIHPTQKPIKLYKWLLTNYAKEGDTILDTHGGSLSIAIACWDLEFDLDIFELDEDYFNDAVKRFENHIRQTQLF
jgi:site-specific DNA-methyltransferase (adenine-specific)